MAEKKKFPLTKKMKSLSPYKECSLIRNAFRLPLIADLYRRGIASPLMESFEVCCNSQFQLIVGDN